MKVRVLLSRVAFEAKSCIAAPLGCLSVLNKRPCFMHDVTLPSFALPSVRRVRGLPAACHRRRKANRVGASCLKNGTNNGDEAANYACFSVSGGQTKWE